MTNRTRGIAGHDGMTAVVDIRVSPTGSWGATMEARGLGGMTFLRTTSGHASLSLLLQEVEYQIQSSSRSERGFLRRALAQAADSAQRLRPDGDA